MRDERTPGSGGVTRTRGWSWWIGRGVWSFGDQGLFAASNFVVNVLLARRLAPEEYGAFVFAYAAFQVVGQVHVGMLIDPMQVFGAGKYVDRFAGYVRTLLRAHCAFAVAAAALFGLIAVALRQTGNAALGNAFAGVAAGGPFLALSWLMRGACTARVRPELAASAGAVNLGLVLIGMHMLHVNGSLSPFSALAVIGVASLVSGGWLVLRLGVRKAVPFSAAERAAVAAEHRAYGRWAAGTGVLSWIPAEVFYLALPIWGGLRETATIKALSNLILPALQTQYVLTNLLTPALVRVRGESAFGRMLRTAGAVAVVGYSLHWVGVGLLREPALRLLYGGRFAEHGELLWVLGAVPLVTGMGAVLTSALRALGRPNEIFWAAIAAAVVALACVGLVAVWGMAGVAAARVVSATVFVVVLAVYYTTGRRGAPAGRPPVAVAALGMAGES